ncbi:flavin reductase (NADPH) [Tetranychus urticae]|uniref:NAD(P)-binding domain-containing protein n=1 Tax=Tetranychus urticae TaxID=32264 RepID=T1KVS0_TETUR|nr:flavin reductase (NADPH) [Tetranychus urticae]
MSSIKKIVIFGATGNTGLATVAKAIAQGFEVTAFVRDQTKLPDDLKVASVVVGDVTNADDVDKAVQGQDAVVVVLGTRTNLGPTTVMSDGTRNIVESMKKHGIKRISVCLSAFLFWKPDAIPPPVINVHEDHLRMETIIKESGLDWVILCPPHIDNADGKGEYKLVKEQGAGPKISKHDLGDALLKVLNTDEWLHTRVGMGY